jgi:hypothetical protein
VNPASVDKIETLITYNSDSKADVKLYLLYAETKERVTSIKEEKLVDMT